MRDAADRQIGADPAMPLVEAAHEYEPHAQVHVALLDLLTGERAIRVGRSDEPDHRQPR
jgi:hypothetical protein